MLLINYFSSNSDQSVCDNNTYVIFLMAIDSADTGPTN